MEENLRKTPLYDRHVALGGKVVPFAGWALPVQYSGLIAEHNAVRTKAGLFDVSHMGEIFVTGPQAEEAINRLTCNDLSKIGDGRAQYNAIINPGGGVVDDIIVYRYSPQKFLICVNASNAQADFEWFTKHNRWDAQFVNKSDEFAQIAIQGPASASIMAQCGAGGLQISELKPFRFVETTLFDVPVIAARTGYTGEDGFEIFIPVKSATVIWDGLLAKGGSHGLVPCGLGARDTLRLEACYPLHGHELGTEISAIESGLGWIVKLEKGEFVGRGVLEEQVKGGAPRTLIGLFLQEAGITRHGDKLYSDRDLKNQVGVITSGTKTPTVNKALALALVQSKLSQNNTELFVEVRGKPLAARIVPKPFYKRAG